MVRGDLLHDIAGLVISVFVENFGGHIRSLIITKHDARRLDPQLTARIGLIGLEIAKLRHIIQLIVDHRRTLNAVVSQHCGDFGGAIIIAELVAQTFFHELR